MSCEHVQVYDAVLDAEQPVIAIRQCWECSAWWKVYGAEFEPPAPEPERVLWDIDLWRRRRLARAARLEALRAEPPTW